MTYLAMGRLEFTSEIFQKIGVTIRVRMARSCIQGETGGTGVGLYGQAMGDWACVIIGAGAHLSGLPGSLDLSFRHT